MSDELVLYTNPMSRGRIARWMMEELGRSYRVQMLDFGPSMKTPAFLALNPMGKVPVVTHGDIVVSECAAICVYLADAFPDAGLAPASASPARADYYRWLFFAAGPVEAAVTAKALDKLAPPDKAAMAGYGTYDLTVDTLEAAVTDKTYIAGDRFSAADVYVGSQISWGLQFGSLPDRPAFRAYWSGLADRPAHRRATELDDAAMPPREPA